MGLLSKRRDTHMSTMQHILFESIDDQEIFESIVSEFETYTVLPSSALVRDNGSYFTFSPFLDTDKYFINFTIDKGLKKQFCIRNLNKLDLTNPLCLNSQLTFTLQNYKRRNHACEIEDIITKISKIVGQELVIEVPEILGEYFNAYKRKVCFTPNAKSAQIPSIEGKHYYLRVYTDYYNEKVVIGSFVLVDTNMEKNISQLDSIFFQERIGIIREKVEYIFQRKKYSFCYQMLKKVNLSELNIHRILNDFITISVLFDNGINPTAKGVGSELSRKIKRLFIYSKYYCNISSDDLINFYKIFIEFYNIAINSDIYFSEKIHKVEIDLNHRISSNKNMNITNWEYFYQTHGIPKEYFGIMEKISVTDYNFKG
ncbi:MULTISPECIES: hypothetical protein [unclassified Streptococcus]|uniref:hypothetical protein n=1 Tax=unclassified Streptococcus TaxID=2608887 RepID=UPI00359D17E2